MRECGRAAIDLFNACEVNPAFVDFVIGLCASDNSGKECYKSFIATFYELYDVEQGCYYRLKDGGNCFCRAELKEAVENTGCCLNVYHDYDVAYNHSSDDMLRELYNDTCNVPLPGDCSNKSPLAASATSVVQCFSALTIMAAVIITFILQ